MSACADGSLPRPWDHPRHRTDEARAVAGLIAFASAGSPARHQPQPKHVRTPVPSYPVPSYRQPSPAPAPALVASPSARSATRYTSGGALGFTRTDLAGMPTFTWYGRTSLVASAMAPTMELSPTCVPASTVA